MGIVFVGHGGCGSAALIQRMWDHGHGCDSRPDIAFFPHDTPALTTSARDGAQVLSPAGYRDLPAPGAIELFAARADGHRLGAGEPIDRGLASYCRAVQRSARHAWLCRAPIFGFLTRMGIDDAVCVVRHPLHQYVSFTKPERHADYAQARGGREAEGAIRAFASAWCAFYADCLDSGSRLVRYERAREDAGDHPFLAWLFAEHLGHKRNHGVLPPEAEALLRDLTEPVWRRIYPSWELESGPVRRAG